MHQVRCRSPYKFFPGLVEVGLRWGDISIGSLQFEAVRECNITRVERDYGEVTLFTTDPLPVETLCFVGGRKVDSYVGIRGEIG